MMTISSTKLKMLKRCQLTNALICSHLLEKSLMENVIFCTVSVSKGKQQICQRLSPKYRIIITHVLGYQDLI